MHHLLFWVCVCVYEGRSLSVLCLCVRVTLPQQSGSLLPLHVFLPLRCSLLWKFRDLKQLGSQTPLCRQTPTPCSLFSTDCTRFHFYVWFLSCSITVRGFHFIHCMWIQWSVPWSLSICLSVSGSRATTVCVAFFCCNTGLLFSFQRNHGVS